MNVICGRYNFKTREPVEEELIKKMCRLFDCYDLGNQGVFCDNEIGIGTRNLNVAKSEQPLTNENALIWVVFEGIIYDSGEIRKYLLQKGHFIKTRDDGELIVHLYEEVGEDCIKKINGMFAFALWDKNLEKLFLFRDRIGRKSFFYVISNGALIFASEIKSILQNKDIKKEIDFEALDYFLSYNYVPAPITLFKNIRKLLPGHYLVCSKTKIMVKKYWDLQLGEVLMESEGFYTEKFSQLLETAVKRNLGSGDSVGLFLSGGIDSSTIGFFMAHLQNRPIKTFTLGFSEQFYDERKIAHFISQHLGTEHYETFLEADKINIKTLKEIIYFLDEPVADSAVFASYYMSKFASRYVQVALSGEGADGVLAGTENYIADKLNYYFTKLPFKYLIKYLFSSLANCLPVSNKPRSLEYKIKCFFQGVGDSSLQTHCRWRQYFSEEEKEKLLIGAFLKNVLRKRNSFGIFQNYFDTAKTEDLINRLLYVDLKVLTPDCFLRIFETMGKSSLLEIRSPFLDYEVVEFLFKIPSDLKLKIFTTKYLLKKTMTGNLPHKVLYREKKGFSAPINIWIKHEWKNMILDILSKDKTKSIGYFNYEYIKQLLEEHFKNIKNNSWKILSLINFYLWFDLYMDS